MIHINIFSDISVIRDFQKDNKKCEELEKPICRKYGRTWGLAFDCLKWSDPSPDHSLFKFTGNDANEEKCKEECEKNEKCVAFSGIWKKWCIGCDVSLATHHQSAIAFKKGEGTCLNILPFISKYIYQQ